MSLIILGPLALWTTFLALTAYGTACCLKYFRRSRGPTHESPRSSPSLSILKPLKGLDPGLPENLRSFFRLDYAGEYEILFSLADPTDPARPVIERLIAQHPQVRARVIIGAVEIGNNPKVNNLIRAYETAAHDWILISDSNVRVHPDYLRQMTRAITPDVGMVTSIVAGTHPRGIGGWLEAVYLNTFYARGMILADRIGKTCVIGKSMMFKKSVARRFGGLRNLARYLAEDYMAGEAMRSLGMRVVIAPEPVPQNIGDHSFGDFWSRHLRWGRIRKAQSPVAFAAELLGSHVFTAALGASAFFSGLDCPFFPPFFAYLIFAAICDLRLNRRFMGKASFGKSLAAWGLRELLAIPLWIHIASGHHVLWRGKRLQVQAGGLLASDEIETLPEWNRHASAYS